VPPACDEIAQRFWRPQGFRDLRHVEEEYLVDRVERPVGNEPRADRAHESADVRLGDPIDPVVVLLGQRPGAGRGGEDLLEAGEVLWPVREVRSGALHDVPRARPDAFDTRVGMLTVRSQALPEQSDDLRWVGGPSRRFDIEVLLRDVAVHVAERVEAAREPRPGHESAELSPRASAR